MGRLEVITTMKTIQRLLTNSFWDKAECKEYRKDNWGSREMQRGRRQETKISTRVIQRLAKVTQEALKDRNPENWMQKLDN
jgi:hypothetical protein